MSQSQNWKWALGLFALLMGLGAALFYPGLDNHFIFDDVYKIRDNPDLHLSSFLLQNFIHDYSVNKSEYHNDPSRPLTFFLYWGLWQAGQGDPFPFHLASLVLHILCAFLVGAITWQSVEKRNITSARITTFIASCLFLSLTMNAGTVAYAYGMSDVLSAFLGLLMVFLFLHKETISSWHMVLLSLIYAAAVFSKQSALVLPAVLVISDGFLKGWKSLQKNWRWHGFFFGLAAAYILWRLFYFGRLGDLEAYNTFPVSIYAPLQGIMIWKYFAWTWIPFHLTIDQAVTQSMYEYWQCGVAWGALFAVSILLLWKSRASQTSRTLSWGWFFFLLALMPTSSFFPTTDLLVERRAYLPSAGLIAGVCLWGSQWIQNRRFSAWPVRIFAVLLLALWSWNSYQSWNRAEIYGNEEQLWKEAKTLFPRNERARINLITYYLKTEQFLPAEKELQEILSLYPSYFEALSDLGALYQHPHNPGRNPQIALEAYRQALKQEPNDLTTLMNFGHLMLELGRPTEALSVFQKVVTLSPNFTSARLLMAHTALLLKQWPLAREQAQAVLQLDAENSVARSILTQAGSQ